MHNARNERQIFLHRVVKPGSLYAWIFCLIPGILQAQQSNLGERTDRVVTEKALINDVPSQAQTNNVAQTPASAESAELYAKFKKLLTGAKLRGQFTVDGRPMNRLTDETYEIAQVEKQPEGDLWVITARIKYGDNDRVFPVPVEVKWAGSTPVITLDNLTLPGLGTFGARVVFHRDKYAGTWQHDDVGGHMFGMIEFVNPQENSKN